MARSFLFHRSRCAIQNAVLLHESKLFAGNGSDGKAVLVSAPERKTVFIAEAIGFGSAVMIISLLQHNCIPIASFNHTKQS
mmetsp:Transcript_9169/g.19565  ORF Transcript_9169/g.19565 Transcript_9169/m.19565 type:complete len:81 (-) Transcript_9169:396-638(-)